MTNIFNESNKSEKVTLLENLFGIAFINFNQSLSLEFIIKLVPKYFKKFQKNPLSAIQEIQNFFIEYNLTKNISEKMQKIVDIKKDSLNNKDYKKIRDIYNINI